MMEKKVLLITSIYSELWGTEFGGRPSRGIHYKQSLLNILNMNPSKCVCFTSKDEYNSLCHFFYKENNIDENILEFRIFDLKDSKYFSKIRSKKDIEKMKLSDRCYEIQYNKFFWFDLIDNVDEYYRVYWIDAGLSHGGLFPKEYWNNNSGFSVNLFNESLLNNINDKTKDKFFILSKNNQHNFFWSQTLPTEYYKNYDRSRHVAGGLFGGKPEMYKLIRDMFNELLVKLLENENELYMEELLLTNLYFENITLFHAEEFDDWYKRNPDDVGIKYFYNMFE